MLLAPTVLGVEIGVFMFESPFLNFFFNGILLGSNLGPLSSGCYLVDALDHCATGTQAIRGVNLGIYV